MATETGQRSKRHFAVNKGVDSNIFSSLDQRKSSKRESFTWFRLLKKSKRRLRRSLKRHKTTLLHFKSQIISTFLMPKSMT